MAVGFSADGVSAQDNSLAVVHFVEFVGLVLVWEE